MTAVEAIAQAHQARVRISVDGDRIKLVGRRPIPTRVVGDLKAVDRTALIHLVAMRAIGEAALESERPIDCTPRRWAEATSGLEWFLEEGWGDRAAMACWSSNDLYFLPTLWSQIWLCGVAWLLGDKMVIDVTPKTIVTTTMSGAILKFYR
jgi:hypothetical protein